MINLPESMIKAMSYETRQQKYNQEKDELIQKMKGASAVELSEALKKLIEKWKV